MATPEKQVKFIRALGFSALTLNLILAIIAFQVDISLSTLRTTRQITMMFLLVLVVLDLYIRKGHWVITSGRVIALLLVFFVFCAGLWVNKSLPLDMDYVIFVLLFFLVGVPALGVLIWVLWEHHNW